MRKESASIKGEKAAATFISYMNYQRYYHYYFLLGNLGLGLGLGLGLEC